MIEQEKGFIQERKDGREPPENEEKGGENLVIEKKPLDSITTLQA
jgi:hypothetical protein